MPQNNLRDNPDGTCNCRPLGKSCFFTDPYDEDGRCDCKCHFSKQNSGEKNPRCRECVKEKCSTCWDCHNALCDIHIQADDSCLYPPSPESEKETIASCNCSCHIKDIRDNEIVTGNKCEHCSTLASIPESGGWEERFITQCFCTDEAHDKMRGTVKCFYDKKLIKDFISQEISSAEERAIERIREIAENLIKNTNGDNQFIPCPRCKGSPTSYPCLCQIYRQGLYDFLSALKKK